MISADTFPGFAQTTFPGFEDLIVAKWKSTVWYIAGKYKDHPNPLFTSCGHDEWEERKWIPMGMCFLFQILGKN